MTAALPDDLDPAALATGLAPIATQPVNRPGQARMVEAVVFDLDGVLLDSEPVWEQVRRAYVQQNGGHWPTDAQDQLMGMSTEEWARYLVDEAGVDESPQVVAAAVVARMAQRYAQSLPLLSGALHAVARLGDRWQLGLASSSPRSLIDSVLATADVAHRFAVTVSTEEVARGKPSPDVYRAVVRSLGVVPEHCVAIEDSSNGLMAAAAAGLVPVAVPQRHYPPSPEALGVARFVATDLDQLTVHLLESLGQL